MKPVFCFGELLLRMSPLPSAQWIHDACLPVYIGGAEVNVAAALASWGLPVNYFTALPQNALSEDVCSVLSSKGIDISRIHFSGNRIGIYYLTQGTDLKHTAVIYDRSHSSFSELREGDIDWNAALQNVGWFHFSAISPALNANVVSVCKEALIAASHMNIPISVDLNHRAKLWQWGKQPSDVMPELVQYCDVIMGNIWSANALLNVPVDTDIHAKESKEAYVQHAKETAEHLMQRYPKSKWVAQTFRFDKNNGIQYYSVLNNKEQTFVSKEYNVDVVKDKVGSGDCFMAGLIRGLYQHQPPQYIVDFAAAAAIGKMNETGDNTKQTTSDVELIMNNNE